MTKKLIHCLICFICAMLIIGGCAPYEDESGGNNTGKDEAAVIGLSFDSFLIERWKRDRDIFVSTAKDLGAEVNVQDAGGNVDRQIDQIKYFIGRGVDAIVVVPIDADKLSEVIKEAKKKGIVVMSYDRLIKNAPLDIYVSFDNKKVGKLMGEALVSRGVSNVLMLSGPIEDSNVVEVNEGFEEVCDNKGISIVDKYYTPGWKAENSEEYLKENINILGRVDAIMCGNDGLATRTARILSERRLGEKIVVTGQDAELEACQRIVQGTQLMTVYKPVEKEARIAAEAVIALLDKRRPAGINASTDNGAGEVDSIILEPIAVDKDNIDNVIIDSGFHNRDEVYMYRKE